MANLFPKEFFDFYERAIDMIAGTLGKNCITNEEHLADVLRMIIPEHEKIIKSHVRSVLRCISSLVESHRDQIIPLFDHVSHIQVSDHVEEQNSENYLNRFIIL